MEKDLLQAVIKVESEIQHSIEAERKRAASWLESVRISLSRELETRKRQLDEEFTRTFESKRRDCEIEAENEIADVKQLAENIQNIPDEALQEVVKEYLLKLLPEECR